MELTDLIKASKKGDQRAQRLLYEQIGARMMGTCMRYIGDRNDAEEVFHDAMLKIFMSLDKYRGDSKFTTWACRIAINTSIDYLRKIKKNPALDYISEQHFEIADYTGLEEVNLTAEKAMSNLSKLSENQQLIINLHVVDDYSHKEIAGMLSITEQASRAMLMRAKKALLKVTLLNKNDDEKTKAIG